MGGSVQCLRDWTVREGISSSQNFAWVSPILLKKPGLQHIKPIQLRDAYAVPFYGILRNNMWIEIGLTDAMHTDFVDSFQLPTWLGQYFSSLIFAFLISESIVLNFVTLL